MEAAYHEAGHVVLAWLSPYHTVAAGIDLHNYGGGAAAISVSKSRCEAAGKPADERAAKDKDIAQTSTVIFMGGYQAELIAAEFNIALKPNRSCADLDYDEAAKLLADVGVGNMSDEAEQAANAVLRDNWNLVEKIAQAAFSKGSLSRFELLDILDPQGGWNLFV